jgi:hypothetical protein
MLNSFEAEIQWLSPMDLIGYVNNVKQHPQWQIDRIASSIAEFGFTVPVVIDSRKVLIAGHGRLEAARKLGLEKIPVIVRNDLTPAQVKALRIADNRVAESPWDMDSLKVELESLSEMNFDLELTGFSLDECGSLFNLGTIDFQGAQIFGESGIPTEPKQPEGSHALPNDGQVLLPHGSAPLESGNNELVKSDGSLLELTQITIAEPLHQVEKGQVWKVGPHILVVAEVLTEWQSWKDFLTGDRTIFAPYPGPFVPLTVKAEEHHLVMVQPDTYIAGHILDQYEAVKGQGSVSRG